MKKIERDIILLGSIIRAMRDLDIDVKENIKDYNNDLLDEKIDKYFPKDDDEYLEGLFIEIANKLYKNAISKK